MGHRCKVPEGRFPGVIGSVIRAPTSVINGLFAEKNVVNPLIGSYINDKNPLVTRQNQKQAKYGDLARTSRVRLIPFVVSTFGGLGPMATELLQY